MTVSATTNGIKFLLTIARVETLAISAVAIMTPATGDTVLPIDADNCIGKMIELLSTPKDFAILGTKGPKAKKEAFPLPINIEARKIRIVITIPIPTAPKPNVCAIWIRPSIKPRLINPLAKISALMINVTTDLKMFPIPFQNMCKEANTCFMFFILMNSKIMAIKKLINIAVVVSKMMGVLKKLKIFENTINKRIGRTGMIAYIKGTSGFSSLTISTLSFSIFFLS